MIVTSSDSMTPARGTGQDEPLMVKSRTSWPARSNPTASWSTTASVPP